MSVVPWDCSACVVFSAAKGNLDITITESVFDDFKETIYAESGDRDANVRVVREDIYTY